MIGCAARSNCSAPQTAQGRSQLRRKGRIEATHVNPIGRSNRSRLPWRSMRDENILSRHLRPAALRLARSQESAWASVDFCGTWMVEAGANLKKTCKAFSDCTFGIYAPSVPESQKRGLRKRWSSWRKTARSFRALEP